MNSAFVPAERPLLTVEGINAGLRSCAHKVLLGLGVYAACLFAVVVGVLLFTAGPSGRAVGAEVLIALLFGSLLVLLGIAFILDRKAIRDPRITCPACAQQVIAGGRKQWLFATRECAVCRNQILAEPAQSPARLRSIEEFHGGVRSCWRRQNLIAIPVTGLMLFLGIGGFAGLGGPAFVIPLALGFLACPLLLLTGLGVNLRRAKVVWGCPHCRKPLMSHYQMVIATRNCVFCARRVVEDPIDRTSRRLVPDEVNQVSRAQERRLWLFLGVPALLLTAALMVDGMMVQDPTLLPSIANREGGIFVVLAILAGPVVPALVGVLGAIWLNHRIARQDVRCHCPHCSTPLYLNSRLVLATGNCCACGNRVLPELL